MTGWSSLVDGMRAIGNQLFVKVLSSDENRTIVLGWYHGQLVLLKLWEKWRVLSEVEQIGAEAEAGLASWAGSGGAVAAASVTVLPDCRMLSSYAFAGIDCAEVFKVLHAHGDQQAIEALGKRTLAATLLQLHEIHTQGWLHRDMKTDNMLLNTTTGSIHLADFGLMVPFGHAGACFSGTAPIKDFGLLDGLSGASPEDLAALHTPVLDVRQLAFSIAAAVLGGRLPNDINIYKTRYITDTDEFLLAVAHTDYATLLHTHLADQQLAHILSSILQPRRQADVPSVQALLHIPELAELAALDMILQDEGRASMQAAHHAAYAAGLEASVLLSQLHCEARRSSGSTGSSSVKPLSAGQQISLLQDRYAAAHQGSSTLPEPSQAGCHLAPAATYRPSGCGFNHLQLRIAKRTVLQLQQYLQRGADSSDADSVQPSSGTSSSTPTSDACSTPHALDSDDSSPDSPCAPMSPSAQLATVTSRPRGWTPQWRAGHFAAAHRATDLEARLHAAAAAAAGSSQGRQPDSVAVSSAGAVVAADLEAQLFAAADAAAAAWPKLSRPCLPANAVSCADFEAQLLASACASC